MGMPIWHYHYKKKMLTFDYLNPASAYMDILKKQTGEQTAR